MAVFAGRDLKKWRESQGITAADLAERISVDVTTIYRYESGKLKPNPDVMYEICDALGDESRWCEWMATEYPASYARVHPLPVPYGMSGSILSLYAVIDEIHAIERQVFADGADGKIDDDDLARNLKSVIDKLLESAQKIKTTLMITK